MCPCRSNYLEPNFREAESVRVLNLLKELGEEKSNFGIYGRPATLDEDTARLCKKCQEVDVSEYSLELQIWWRDHQEADKRRIQKKIDDKKKEQDRKIALSKLTKYERELLGV